MVRSAVITLLKDMNQSVLAKLSPLSQSAISNIANWKYNTMLSTEKCQRFGEWFKKYRAEKNEATDLPFDTTKESRLTFHPEHEIPMMRRWYNLNKNPSDEKLYFYANELNKGCVRQERPMVTVAKLKNWWKNERQREKRLSTHTYRKLSMDPPSFSDVGENIPDKDCRMEKQLPAAEEQKVGLFSERTRQTEKGRQSVGSASDSEIIIQGASQCSEGRIESQHSVERRSQSADNVTYPSVSEMGHSSSQPTGFVSLLHNAADAENGNQVILSDGTVVRAVSLLPAGLVRAEAPMQGTSVPGASQLNVVRGGAWNQYSPRMPAPEHPGAPDRTDQSGHRWA